MTDYYLFGIFVLMFTLSVLCIFGLCAMVGELMDSLFRKIRDSMPAETGLPDGVQRGGLVPDAYDPELEQIEANADVDCAEARKLQEMEAAADFEAAKARSEVHRESEPCLRVAP